MQLSTQLAVFLENRPGMLGRVVDALAKAHVNIYAMSSSDTVDHTVIRMVVNDPQKALYLFEERGTLVVADEILMIEGDNRPGSLGEIATKLGKARINIEYAYFATLPKSKKGLLILRVDRPKQALKVLNT
ncbi:MAG TPA: amino acid-binding protein [Verrucomicrobiales bacterium]|nr:amino acid-binding protein [Verrucomicrobiales bacterium]